MSWNEFQVQFVLGKQWLEGLSISSEYSNGPDHLKSLKVRPASNHLGTEFYSK